jgi:FkbM family methyltransferase
MVSFIRKFVSRRKARRYDAETVAVMDRVLGPRSVCVDVGAHVGDILGQMLERAPEGTHYAFEPIPGCFREIERRFGGRANVITHEVALSDAPGRSSFTHVVSRPTFSGLRPRQMEREETIASIEVECARLDDLVPRVPKVDFIKIDVEGGEFGVFRGAVDTLRCSRPHVVFEHGRGGADKYGVSPEQVYDLLHGEAKLAVSLMSKFLDGAPPLEREAFSDEFSSGRNYYFIAYPA